MGDVQGSIYRKLTWPKVKASADAGRSVVLIPVGAIEQHGPHLPVDVDNLIIEAICERSAEIAGSTILVAPPIHYGYNEHNMDFPGTISIRPQVFSDFCADVARSFARHGFENIVFVNGHGSNAILLELAARQVTIEHQIRCASVSWWSVVTDVADGLRESVTPGGMSHAGEAETSLYMHLDPQHVGSPLISEVWNNGSRYVWHDLFHWSPVRFVDFHSKRSRSGITGDPTVANARKGEALIEAAATAIARFAEELLSLDWGVRGSPTADPT